MKRANQLVMVPLSQETIASSRRRLPSSCATTCGFIGLSVDEACFRIGLSPILHAGLRLLQEFLVGLADE